MGIQSNKVEIRGVQQRKLADTHAPRLYDVVKRLQNKGTYASFSKCDMPKRKANEANVEQVKDFFETNPQKPTSAAAEELDIPKTTVYYIKIIKFPDKIPFKK